MSVRGADPVEATRRGLAAFLSKEWGESVEADGLHVASAGARRQNLLFDAVRRNGKLALVATVIPNPAIQVMEIEVEASLLHLAEEAGVPVAHLHAVCTDPSFLGGPFFVTTRVDGETIPRQVLRLVAGTAGLGARLGHQCGEALARLHVVDPVRAHPGLLRPSAGRTPAEAALQGLVPLLDGLLQPSPAFELGLRWLERHLPASRPAILHGDFRNGNIIVGEEGLRAALDWEVAHVGDPMEDLAWLCLRMWRFRSDTLEVGGFATRDDLCAGYEAAGGRWDEQSFHWWKTLGTLRWGLGLAGQAKAHLDGSVPSIVMAASGRRVAEMEYDLLMLLRSAYR